MPRMVGTGYRRHVKKGVCSRDIPFEISEQMIDEANAVGGLGLTHNARGPDKPATGLSWNEGGAICELAQHEYRQPAGL